MILLKNLGRFIVLSCFLAIQGLVFADDIVGHSLQLSEQQRKVYTEKNINLLGIIQLKRSTYDGRPLMEFSGLAWDHDENILYALSDRGYVVHLVPTFEDKQLIAVSLTGYYKLQNAQGKSLSKKLADSEGLALANANNKKKNDTELIISFERAPRIIHYSPEGVYLKQRKMKYQLNDISNYSGANKSLEAITEHEKYDLVFAPERPLKKDNEYLISIYSIKNHDWHFLPDNKKFGSLVGLTTLPDNKVIALERSFPGVFAGLTTTVHLLELFDFTIEQKTLFQLKPTDGYFNDNFEGITWHEDNRFFMISDDNDNAIQRSLLIYFEITSLDD